MSPVLPFDITALIIDIVGENNDTDLLKELALVSHSFHQICSKHLFATVHLHDRDLVYYDASSKKGFIELVKSRPNVVNYIRKLTYKVDDINDDDHLLSSILSNFLPTTSRLNYLAIDSDWIWNTMASSLTSAFLHLMHLPTINHVLLSHILDFPLSSLTSCVNLNRLDIHYLDSFDYSKIVQSETMPKIRELRTSHSNLPMTKLLHAKMQNGRPAFNFMDLRRLWMRLGFDDDQNIQYLLQNARLLEKLHLSVVIGESLVGLHDILSPIARTLKVLSLTVYTYFRSSPEGLCEGLQAMAGHYMLEALSIEFVVARHDTEDSIGSKVQNVARVLVKPGWSSLRHVSFNVSCQCWMDSAKLSEALQFLPDKYLNHLSKLESISFNYSFSDEYCRPDSFLF